MTGTSTISIATKPQVYGVFVHMRNTPHNAFAEYVDNSLSSFEKNIGVLKPINANGKVRVDITISKDAVVIEDNAFGIEESEYARAFELATPPLDASGLNEFGMGMKISSIWLSRHWMVESSAYGEPVKKTFVFDLADVIDNDKTQTEVLIETAKADDHYTRITLTDLSSNCPTSEKKIKDIGARLASIYSRKINDGLIDIYLNGVLLSYTPYEPLSAPYYKTPDAEPMVWRKEINFTFGPKRSIRGFIGILSKMKADENGFLLFRRGRTIGTSGSDKFRPKCLCGPIGGPQYKLIYGEFDIEGFNVSYSKDQFSDDEDFEALMEALAEDIKKDKDFDIFGQAQNYRSRSKAGTSEERRKKFEEKAREVFSGGKSKSEQKDEQKETQDADGNDDANSEEETESTPTSENESPTSESESQTCSCQLNVRGVVLPLEIELTNDSDVKSLFLLSKKNGKPNELCMKIFLKHRFFSADYYPTLTDVDKAAPMLELLKAMAYAQMAMTEEGKPAEAADFISLVNASVCNIK